MDIRRFFSRNPIVDSMIDIDSEEAYHLRKVLRVKIAAEIEITDGTGSLYYGKIDGFIKDIVRVKIYKTEKYKKSSNRIIIAPSLLKRNAMNLMIEKLSEIGVDEITPVLFNRTELKPSDNLIQKWEKIAIASLKVNKQVWLTKINIPIKLSDLIENYNNIENKFMLDIDGNTKINESPLLNTLAVIGPPGDYIKQERDNLINEGYSSTKINNSILKVETAAISISSILKEQELIIGNN